MKFLIECLADLDEQFKLSGGPGLLMFQGKPTTVFRRLHEELGINKICYEQDCEPIWNDRDKAFEKMCAELGIQTVEKISHTLWDPKDVININGGYAPLTYQMMLHSVHVLGLPQRPVNDSIDFSAANFNFGKIPEHLAVELRLMTTVTSTTARFYGENQFLFSFPLYLDPVAGRFFHLPRRFWFRILPQTQRR